MIDNLGLVSVFSDVLTVLAVLTVLTASLIVVSVAIIVSIIVFIVVIAAVDVVAGAIAVAGAVAVVDKFYNRDEPLHKLQGLFSIRLDIRDKLQYIG